MEKKLLEFYEKKNGSLFACDQDTINGGLKGQIYFCLPDIIFSPITGIFPTESWLNIPGLTGLWERGEFLEAKGHPAIIHYAGDERPWIRGI